MDCDQGTTLLKMVSDFLQSGIRVLFNELSQSLPFFDIEFGGPVSSWPWRKESSLSAFPNPPADTVNMIAKDFGELLPARHA